MFALIAEKLYTCLEFCKLLENMYEVSLVDFSPAFFFGHFDTILDKSLRKVIVVRREKFQKCDIFTIVCLQCKMDIVMQ